MIGRHKRRVGREPRPAYTGLPLSFTLSVSPSCAFGEDSAGGVFGLVNVGGNSGQCKQACECRSERDAVSVFSFRSFRSSMLLKEQLLRYRSSAVVAQAQGTQIGATWLDNPDVRQIKQGPVLRCALCCVWVWVELVAGCRLLWRRRCGGVKQQVCFLGHAQIPSQQADLRSKRSVKIPNRASSRKELKQHARRVFF